MCIFLLQRISYSSNLATQTLKAGLQFGGPRKHWKALIIGNVVKLYLKLWAQKSKAMGVAVEAVGIDFQVSWLQGLLA